MAALERRDLACGSTRPGHRPGRDADPARPRGPARALPRARQRGRRDGRDRPGRGRARRLHDRLPDAQHDARDRRARRGGAGARRGRCLRDRRSGSSSTAPSRSGRTGETLAAMGELADAGVVGLLRRRVAGPRSRAPAQRAGLRRLAGPAGHRPPRGPDAHRRAPRRPRGYVATVLGLKGWPVAGEAGAVARAIAILADAVADVPGARLHLTHVSTAASLAHVRAAKAAGLPGHLRRDAAPPRASPTSGSPASRRWAWEALDDDGTPRDPWTDGSLVAAAVRHRRSGSTRRSAPPEDAAACLAALADGTADAIATDHAPHTEVDKHVEFGWAINGISGIETALRDRARGGGGRRRVAGARGRGADHRPGAVLGERHGRRARAARGRAGGSRRRGPAATWTVTPRRCSRRARTRRCWAASCAGSCG